MRTRTISALGLTIILTLAVAGIAAAHGPGMGSMMPGQPPNAGQYLDRHMDDHWGNGGNHMDEPWMHPGDADHYYCSETGHYLSYGFKTFWERNGGVAVFGYPMTEEMREHGFTVQYLERQRFEYHAEHAGTPYEVELGLLGTEQAQRLGLFGMSAFAHLPENTTSAATSTYFPQTGHSLGYGFRDYFMAHGLDLGDPGVSLRESIALFGYPISQEFTDPASGLTVQYFERAVFEYHPNNPPEYQVLLQRLGADHLDHE